MIHEAMLAELLPVIGRYHDDCIVQPAPGSERFEQFAELRIQPGNRAVIRGALRVDLRGAPIASRREVVHRPTLSAWPELSDQGVRGQVRGVRIHEVEKHEERPLVFALEPVQEISIDHTRVLTNELLVVAQEPTQLRDRESRQPRVGDSHRDRDRIVFIVREATLETAVTGRVHQVGDETGRRVTAFGKALRKRRVGIVERGLPSGRQLVRIAARENAGVSRQRPR